jgi:hypothetical protein
VYKEQDSNLQHDITKTCCNRTCCCKMHERAVFADESHIVKQRQVGFINLLEAWVTLQRNVPAAAAAAADSKLPCICS